MSDLIEVRLWVSQEQIDSLPEHQRTACRFFLALGWEFNQRGGKREGAGRKPSKKKKQSKKSRL